MVSYKTSRKQGIKTVFHPPHKNNENNTLSVEVATLREQLRSAETEKGYLNDKIEDLRARAERAEKKEDDLQRLLPAPDQDAPANLSGKKLTLMERITGRVTG